MADNDVTRIAGNIGAMNALYALTNINKQLSVHQTRLATGRRINSAADDPAGLAISTKMMSRSEGLKVALSNIGDAKNLLAVAESGLGRLTDILNSMRMITENAANDTNGTEERKIVKEQLASYAQQINDIVAQTKWSDKKLIGGGYSLEANALTFQTGADYGETTKLYGLADMQASALGLLNDAVTASAAAVGTATVGTDYSVSVATLASGSTELASGTYSIRTSITSVTGGFTYSAQLLASDGVTTIGSAVTGTYDNSVSTSLSFGNGLSAVLSSGMLAAAVSATVSATDLGTGMTAAISTLASGATELASGTYTVDFSVSGDGNYSAQVMNGTVAVGSAVTGAYSSGVVVDLNGLSVTLGAGMAGTAATVSTSAIGTGMTAAVSALASGATALADGTYTVAFSVTGDNTYSAQVMNGTVAVGSAVTGAYSSGVVVDLNGLSVTLGAGLAGTAASISTSAIGTDLTASISTLASGETALASGTYTVDYSIAGTTGAYTYTAQLMNGTVAVGAALTGTYDAVTTPTTLDFGNLEVLLATGLDENASGLSSDEFTFTESTTVVSTSNSFQYAGAQTKVTSSSAFAYTASVPADTSATKDSGSFTYTASVTASAASVDMGLSGLNGTVAVSNADDFAAYMKKIDDAMVLVNSQLSKIGSLTGSLTFKEDQVSSSQINIEASYNRIMNANMAEEQVNASKLMILQQTSTAMLAQANAAPQFLLSLFK